MNISTKKKSGQTEQTAVKSPKMKWLLSMSLSVPFVVSRQGMVWAPHGVSNVKANTLVP